MKNDYDANPFVGFFKARMRGASAGEALEVMSELGAASGLRVHQLGGTRGCSPNKVPPSSYAQELEVYFRAEMSDAGESEIAAAVFGAEMVVQAMMKQMASTLAAMDRNRESLEALSDAVEKLVAARSA